MTETKVKAASVASGLTAAALTPLVLYVMAKLGDDANNPLTVGAATAIALLLFYGVPYLAGRMRSSSTSAVSDGYDPSLARRLEADRATRRDPP